MFNMEWVLLVIAGCLEIAWAIGLKYTIGFTRFWPSVFTIITMILSFIFLSQAIKVLPIGNAYAIWTGIGVVGTTILGVILFSENINLFRVLCISLILIGIVGLRVITK